MWTKVGIKTTLKAMERLTWINKADQTIDPTQRAAVYGQVLKRLQDQAYLGEGHLVPMNYVITKKLQGLTTEFGIPDFTGVWLSQ